MIRSLPHWFAKRLARKGLYAALVLSTHSGWAQVSYPTLGGTYSQNFSTLTTTGTSAAITGGNLNNLNAALNGWYFVEAGTSGNTQLTAGTGSGNGGDTYSFGATSNTERALGGLQSGSVIPTVGFYMTNNTGSTITSIVISYIGEQWRLGATGRTDRLDFEYSLNATSLTTGTWTAVTALNFNAPNSTGTVGALDGNAAANRATVSSTITGLSIANGSTFFIRWNDVNATGADDGLGVDDFSLVGNGAPASPTVGFAATTSNTSEGLLATVNVSMNVAPAGDVTVTVSDLGTGSATSTSDYTALSPAPTLTFLTSDTYPKTLNISIPITDDVAAENAETIDLGLAVTTGTATLGTSAHTVTIAASDLPTVGFVAATSSTTEGATATVDVSMNVAPATDVTVQITRTGGTATSGTDFTTFPATNLTFLAAGVYPQTQSVSVITTDDADFEAAETVILGLALTAGSSQLGTTSHTLTINDNELATLVINEIDYDNVGTDNAEYLELFNYGSSAINLNGFKVELFNGNGNVVYQTINLPNTSVAAGGYFVIGNNSSTPNINMVVTPTTNLLQNGDPDAIGLRSPGNTMVDAVSYKGSVAAPYVEGTGTTAGDDNTTVGRVIARVPNGVDSNNNNADWQVWCATPGTLNNPDSDGDGTADCTDGCPNDPNKTSPGTCGCGVADTDSDNDGIADCIDVCPLSVNTTTNLNLSTCNCETGYYANYTTIGSNQVLTGCTQCPAGSYCPDGVDQLLCPAGYFSSVVGQSSCTACAAGSFSDVTGSEFCQSCPAGSFSDVIASTVCQNCPAGSFSDVTGSTVCQSCPAGSFSDVTGSTLCQSCPAGSFSDVTGSTVCQSCPAGSFSDVTGSTLCQSCPAGYFSDVTGSTACQGCPAGTFSDVTGSTYCQSCPAGTFNPDVAQIVCLSCPNGESSQTGAIACFDDADDDNVDDATDNCVGVGNPGQEDADMDGVGDACDGCPNDPNKTSPGTCGCGVADVDTDSDGTLDCNDGCPNDPLKTAPGNCGCGNVETGDTDEDGVADCVDGCPLDDTKTAPGNCGCGNPEPGAACDDGDNTTGDDTVQPDCSCAGVPVDCNYVPSGPDMPGSPCDDGNIETQNDTWTVDCLCVGDYMDCLGVPGGPALPGTACDDGLATTGNDMYDADCTCAGEFIDCAGVPGGSALVGTPCDDGNNNSTNDEWQADCSCAGIVLCAGNLTTMEIATDSNGAQTSWEVVPSAGGAALCSGSGYGDNATISAGCCLPNGCYRLIVYDSFGDGMTTGGYRLLDPNGKRIIDNWGDGVFTNVSAIANNGAFCVPIGADVMQASSCDRLDLLANSVVAAVPNPAVSNQFGIGSNNDDGYQFWIYSPDGDYSRLIYKSLANPGLPNQPFGPTAPAYLALNSIVTSPVPLNVKLNIRVRTRVNGVNSEFGPACTMMVVPASTCPTTQLVNNTNSTQHSCGVSGKVVGASGNTGKIFCNTVGGANKYQWRIADPLTGYVRQIATGSAVLQLSNWSTSPLLCGTHTYNVTVRASFDNGATFCPFGAVCTVGITNNNAQPLCTPGGGAFAGGGLNMSEEVATGMQLWPNPVMDGSVNVELDGIGSDVHDVRIVVLDLYGKVVVDQVMITEGANELRTSLQLGSDVASGVYVVNVTAGDKAFNQRLVVE